MCVCVHLLTLDHFHFGLKCCWHTAPSVRPSVRLVLDWFWTTEEPPGGPVCWQRSSSLTRRPSPLLRVRLHPEETCSQTPTLRGALEPSDAPSTPGELKLVEQSRNLPQNYRRTSSRAPSQRTSPGSNRPREPAEPADIL